MSDLKTFLQELGTNSKLLKLYKAAPKETMAYYGLNKKEIKAVLTANLKDLNEILGDDCPRYMIVHPPQREHGY